MILHDTERTIRVCGSHLHDPCLLIWTFAFNGAEYWCPKCGNNYGMLGAGTDIEADRKLKNKLYAERGKYKKLSKQFLKANSLLVCSQTKYKGKWIEFEELPKKSQTFWINKSKSWEYKYD